MLYVYIYIYIYTYIHSHIHMYIFVYTHHAESSTQYLVQNAYAISIAHIDARSINHTIY